MSRERWLDEALEAGDRAFFARRARALAPAPVPELATILAAADARRPRTPRTISRTGVLVAVSLGVAAAAVVGIAAASSVAGHARASRAIVADEGDASVPVVAGWTSYEPPVCEQGAEEPYGGESCAAVPASLVVASSDTLQRACVESLEAPHSADDFALTCRREPEMSSP